MFGYFLLCFSFSIRFVLTWITLSRLCALFGVVLVLLWICVLYLFNEGFSTSTHVLVLWCLSLSPIIFLTVRIILSAWFACVFVITCVIPSSLTRWKPRTRMFTRYIEIDWSYKLTTLLSLLFVCARTRWLQGCCNDLALDVSKA